MSDPRDPRDEAHGPTVLFIGGLGRSGSTLLDLMLGQLPGFCAVGELSYVWGRKDEDLCGCGRTFETCHFWRRVGEEAFGGWSGIDREEMVRLRSTVDRTRRIVRLLRRASGNAATPQAAYAARMFALYRGVAAASGASVIVDSTKHLSTSLLVRTLPGVDLRLVHLVRDSRGVAYSWTKRVEKTWIAGEEAYMDRFTPARTAVRWLGFNAGFQLLGLSRTPVARVRYEDLVRDPVTELRRITSLAGAEVSTFPFLHGRRVELAEVHTIGGNPVRLGASELDLAIDDAWRERLRRSDRLVVTATTLPLLAAYGYLRRDSRRGP